MEILQKGDRRYLQSTAMRKTGLVSHGFTGRCGGVSHGIVEGLNLGFRVGDDPASVCENYRLVGEDLGIRGEQFVSARQAHTDCIRMVSREDCGKGLLCESDLVDTDALMTDEPGVALVAFAADCLPILLLDPVHRAIAAVHAGWRGSEKDIAGKTVAQMQDAFGTRPQDVLAAMGPSIGPCCFAFGEDAPEHFDSAFCKKKADGGYLVDLWGVNRAKLLARGLLSQNIDAAEVCTVCRAEAYYSYRTQKEHTGRQAAIIMLRS